MTYDSVWCWVPFVVGNGVLFGVIGYGAGLGIEWMRRRGRR